MNEKQILETILRIAEQAKLAGHCRQLEVELNSLLTSKPDNAGGPLVQWWNREQDTAKRNHLRDVITIVATLNAKRANAIDNAAINLPGLCELISKGTEKTSRQKSEHAVTKWVRKNRHKYRTNAEAVRAFIQLHGGEFKQLYKTDLHNDLGNNPLSKPKKTS